MYSNYGGSYYSSGPGPGGGERGGHRRPPQQQQQQQQPPPQQPQGSIQNTILSMNATKSAFSCNNLRTAELQKEKKAAAASRRQEQQLREAAKDDLYEGGPGLFDCPQKVQADPQSQIVNQVLGRFEKAVINTPSCIGIDYQPQTPAPVQHIIGEEDEDPKPRRPPTLTRPNGSRLPENISQTHRPAARNNSSGSLSSQAPGGSSRSSSAMLPPPAPPRSKSNNQPFLPPQAPPSLSKKHPGDSLKTRPKQQPSNSSNSLTRSNSADYEESKKVQDMIRQMKDPISGFSNQMPALLPAIVTPSITEHEGNNSRAVPKYFMTPSLPPIGKLPASPPLHHGASSSKSTLSEDSESDKEEERPMGDKGGGTSPLPKASNSDSNSTAESSSEDSSESEEEDLKAAQEDSNEDEDEFSLANLAKKANLSKFSPSSGASFKEHSSPEKKALGSSTSLESPPPPTKSPPDVDIDFISGLLTTSTPDINLDFGGSSNLPIDRPISPMKQSPEHAEEEHPPPRRRASNSASVLLTADSSDEEPAKPRAPRSKRSRSSKDKSHRKAAVAKRTLSSEDEEAPPPPPPAAAPTEAPPKEDSPPIAAPNKKKSMALGNIFGVKTSSSKGGGKGKAGIKVEVIERASCENPPVKVVVPVEKAKAQEDLPRPQLLCRIPLALLNHPLPPLSRRHHNHARTTHAIENLYSRRRNNLFDDDEVGGEKGSVGSGKRRSKSSSASAESSSSSKRLKLEGGEPGVDSKLSEYLVEQNNKCMMPPPSKRSSYHLLESSKDEEEDNEEEHNFCMSEAKRLKDEADKERDREQQAMKYIQAVLYFILCGNITERSGDKNLALVMYNETLSFIRDVCRPFKNSEFGNFDNKLAALSLRCQSLLYLKMYKLTQNEYRECQKIIGEHIMKAASQQNSPNSNTPSPAGSDGSRSSGYTSSGEINNVGRYSGVTTPPTSSLPGPASSSSHLPPQCLSVPQNVMKKHFQYGNYLTQCHDLWEQADMYLHRGHCEEFIKRLDRMCGSLTLHSALKDLVKYIRTGLNFWSKEREEAQAAASSNHPPPNNNNSSSS